MVTDDVFAVIAEATRRDILVSLRDGDKAVGELVQELEASQPTISKHLKVLREADLVSMRAQGQKRYYALNRTPLAGVASWLETFDVGRAAEASPPAAPAPAPAAAAQPGPLAAAASPASGALPTAAPGAPIAPSRTAPDRPAPGVLSPAVALPVGTAAEDKRPQQIGRTVGRAATRAADLLANLPKFGRKK
ncbi:helix-turn-helix transcriptional regulator [Arthrobacter sp. B3I4]|uniref:ArsR/SmtB family transcription factor n=1 Tax=Arthrobacter sp. B3I4 TaxID=3042267 RepID=UPI002783C269|nr:metalloregulator ArsR/SmtB family transcription factor [Arthrobacter sp. B3I4]MDQ0755262.1 DNA-binding transcriptional ArsR family regulator [Arthrobacter sp. B3I4]